MEEQKEYKDLTQISREAIRQVFQHFDKDSNGYIDLCEIELLAKELKMKDDDIDQCKKAMEEIDINKDGKICFEEFWEWWRRGGSGRKMDKLIYLKLKAMRLLSQANSEFIRYGGSLEVEHEDNKCDTHYISLNHMESEGKIQLKINGQFFNNYVLEDRKLIFQGFDHIKEEEMGDLTGFYFKFKCNNENQEFVRNQLQKILEDIVRIGKLHNPLNILYNFLNNSKVITKIINDEICGYIQIDLKSQNAIENDKSIGQAFRLLISYLKMSQMSITSLFSLRNGFKELLVDTSQKFVKWLLQGFIIQQKIIVNRGYLKKFRNILKAQIEKKQHKNEKHKSFQKQSVILGTLLSSSKFRVTFKDIEDVEEFFSGLGLEEMCENQPSIEEVVEEIVLENYDIIKLLQQQQNINQQIIKQSYNNNNNNNKNNTTSGNVSQSKSQQNGSVQEQEENNSTYETEEILLIKLLNVIKLFQSGTGSFSVHYKKSFVNLEIKAEGLSEFIDYIIQIQQNK